MEISNTVDGEVSKCSIYSTMNHPWGMSTGFAVPWLGHSYSKHKRPCLNCYLHFTYENDTLVFACVLLLNRMSSKPCNYDNISM